MPITADDRLLLHSLTQLDHAATRHDDATLIGLVRAAQTGNTRAGEKVLAALAFPLASMASRSSHTTLAHFVSSAWFVIEGFNCEREVKVLTNLVMDTLKQVTRDRVSRWDDRVVPSDGVERWGQEREEESGSAASLIEAAQRLELIDERTTRILRSVYVEGLPGAEVALREGITHAAIRQRSSRAVRVLREHRRHIVASQSS
ncbi:hypothetical protein M3G03_00690 [Aestuariimicrobium sp. p3-SID1156]|uniref:RNA polymerase sigma factor n=1 Tax=Aestuariimicrobium sp. p3-SID1156 TaxID=2916038 RepID=UPI00223A7958|nr:sigma factor-like helix-turn-helix DNA-binding protein [Aestuariimicrobium sp. p3-SID1156]MCT1458072.1 hypothetical protein [Aestuariimicrobium sp. p3-SID1156]